MEDNVKVAEQFFAALNAHDLDAMDALRNSDFESDASSGRMNFERNRRYVQNLVIAFPDLHFTLERIIAQGNYVVVNWVAVGTHNGAFRTPTGVSIPPTGKTAQMSGSHTFEIRSDKIAHSWFFTDMASLLTQLGLMPPV